MEVQAHGNSYESDVIKERTGLTKDEYDALKGGGYTDEFDLVSGLIVDYNGSVKSTGSNTVDCADIQKKMEHKEYNLIVGQYDQVDDNKVFHTEYEFFITPADYDVLWGSMREDDIDAFVGYIKSIPSGKEAQKSTTAARKMFKEEIQDKNALYTINAKVDSKNQRRVQCSLKIKELIASGIKYKKRDINYTYHSPKRKFKSKAS
jgi:hypothetical protein